MPERSFMVSRLDARRGSASGCHTAVTADARARGIYNRLDDFISAGMRFCTFLAQPSSSCPAAGGAYFYGGIFSAVGTPDLRGMISRQHMYGLMAVETSLIKGNRPDNQIRCVTEIVAIKQRQTGAQDLTHLHGRVKQTTMMKKGTQVAAAFQPDVPQESIQIFQLRVAVDRDMEPVFGQLSGFDEDMEKGSSLLTPSRRLFQQMP